MKKSRDKTPKELEFAKTLSGENDMSIADAYRGGRDYFKKKLKGVARGLTGRG
jgi:hypothetical protein